MLEGELETLVTDIEEKKVRIEKAKTELTNANYEGQTTQFNNRSRALEDKRDILNTEIRTLSLEADTRARLNLKRDEVKSKTNELKNMYVL